MSIILHILCKNIGCSKKGYCSFEKKVRHEDMHTAHYSKGMVQLFKEYFIFCMGTVPAKTHCIAPEEDLLSFRMVCCISVLNIAFVGRYGGAVIMLKPSSIFCRHCVLLKGRCSSTSLRSKDHLGCLFPESACEGFFVKKQPL